MQRAWAGLTALGAALLAGCGGGGGSGGLASSSTGGGTPPTPAIAGEAQGVYAGSFSSAAFPNGYFNALILEDDEVWTLYGNLGTSGQLIVYGMAQGQGTSNNRSFSSPSFRDFYFNGTVTTGTLTATYVPGTSFVGSATAGGQSISFSGTGLAGQGLAYSYDTPARLADIVGAWSVTTLDGSALSLNVDGSGNLLGSTAYSCPVSGTIRPRSSGKNVFDLSLVYATVPACGSLSGVSGRGVGLTTLLTDGRRQLVLAAVSSDRSMGSAGLAVR